MNSIKLIHHVLSAQGIKLNSKQQRGLIVKLWEFIDESVEGYYEGNQMINLNLNKSVSISDMLINNISSLF